MICMTPEAIASQARISMEARQEASRQGAPFAWPGLVGRLLKAIDLRRLADAIRRAIPRTPRARIYDSK